MGTANIKDYFLNLLQLVSTCGSQTNLGNLKKKKPKNQQHHQVSVDLNDQCTQKLFQRYRNEKSSKTTGLQPDQNVQ